MYEPVLTDEKLDLYNVYEVHKNYRILAMAVNVPEWAVKAFEEGILYFDALTPDTPPIELFIKTLEGTMHAPVGSYVIQGVRGEIYCCKEDIFLETYEPVLERE